MSILNILVTLFRLNEEKYSRNSSGLNQFWCSSSQIGWNLRSKRKIGPHHTGGFESGVPGGGGGGGGSLRDL